MTTIPVFYASDENYVKALAVSMASVLANTKQYIQFIILENNISLLSKEKLNKLKDKFNNFSIEYINIDMKKFYDFPDLNWYSLNMYSRFCIPDVKPLIDKAIYLDVDIILKSDILNLYDVDIKNYPLAAVVGEKKYLNDKFFVNHIRNLGINDSHIYFGSGVLLINCDLWRRNKYFENLLKIVLKQKEILKYPDQDALNILFQNNYKRLDLNWNRDIKCLEEEYKQKKDVLDNVFLIHYDGQRKPWNSKVFASEYFFYYAKFTDFEDELQQERNKLLNSVKYIFLWKYLYKISIPPFRKYFKKKYKVLKNYI